MSCFLRICAALLFGWMSSYLLRSDGGGNACVGYHLLCTMIYAWLDKDVDISYDAVQVNHNHEYRSSVQANYVNYPRLYQAIRNMRFFDVVYATLLAVCWTALSTLPSVDDFGSVFVCFLCVFLPTSGVVRFCFTFLALANVSFLLNWSYDPGFAWLSFLRSFIFVLCFVMDRFVCLPMETHGICSILLLLFSRNENSWGIALIPAVAPVVFGRVYFDVKPSHLMLSTAVFLTITVINQHS